MGLLFLGLGDKTKLSLHADDNKFVTRVLSLWSRSLAGRFFKFLELVYSMLDVWCYKTKCFVTSVWSINELVNKWLVLLNSRNPNQSWFIWIETTASEEGRNSMFVFFFFCKVKFREKKSDLLSVEILQIPTSLCNELIIKIIIFCKTNQKSITTRTFIYCQKKTKKEAQFRSILICIAYFKFILRHF